jgi:hypothetical protein
MENNSQKRWELHEKEREGCCHTPLKKLFHPTLFMLIEVIYFGAKIINVEQTCKSFNHFYIIKKMGVLKKISNLW